MIFFLLGFYRFIYLNFNFFVLCSTTTTTAKNTWVPFKIKITSIFGKLLTFAFFHLLLLCLILATTCRQIDTYIRAQLTTHLFIKHHWTCLLQFSLVLLSLPCTSFTCTEFEYFIAVLGNDFNRKKTPPSLRKSRVDKLNLSAIELHLSHCEILTKFVGFFFRATKNSKKNVY